MIRNNLLSCAFWHEVSGVEPIMRDEFLVIVLPEFTGIGYVPQDSDFVHSSDPTIDGAPVDSITYWAELPEFPNAY